LPYFKITLAYDGATFVGWQRQPAGVSVQGLLEDALATLDKRPVAVSGAGRTDAGVHALGQVAAFELRRDDMDAATVMRALNAALPPAVRVLSAREVPRTFHPRFGARAKTYQYRIWNSEVLSPFERGRVWHIPVPPLDVAAMAAAAARLEGRHDFAAFQGTGVVTHTTERVVFRSSVRTLDASPFDCAPALSIDGAGRDRRGDAGAIVSYDIRGEGFLRYMVRNIVGTLVEIGRGKRPAAWMDEVLASADRTQAGRTAPPEGLFLVSVEYDAQL
jgi:tRNA pseudouridine38-40 synthase